jgi:hypothetical protein
MLQTGHCWVGCWSILFLNPAWRRTRSTRYRSLAPAPLAPDIQPRLHQISKCHGTHDESRRRPSTRPAQTAVRKGTSRCPVLLLQRPPRDMSRLMQGATGRPVPNAEDWQLGYRSNEREVGGRIGFGQAKETSLPPLRRCLANPKGPRSRRDFAEIRIL